MKDELKEKVQAMTADKLFIGQVLYREVYHRKSMEIKPYTISKIGKKYFYLLEDHRFAIDIKFLKYQDKNYSQFSFVLYRTEQEIKDRHEKNVIINALQKSFDWQSNANQFTIEQLKEVSVILGLYKEQAESQTLNS